MMSINDLKCKTLEETYLSLEKFLRASTNDSCAISKIINSCREDAFEISVKLIIIDRLQLHEELKKCIFSLEKGVVRRAVKCSWFFKLAANSFFIEDVFPIVSVSTRLKVITALAKYVEDNRIEELYNYVRGQFGFLPAEPLLSRCPKEIIRKLLVQEKRRVKPQTYLYICQRYPDVGIEIGKVWITNDWHIPEAVGHFLAMKHPDLLRDFSLKELQRFHVKMGKKVLRKYMQVNRDQILSLGWEACLVASQSSRVLYCFTEEARIEGLVKLAREKNMSIRTWKNIVYEVHRRLQHLPAQQREFLLESTFKQVFGKDLWENPNALTLELLEMITSNRRSQLLRHEEFRNDKYIYLNPPAVAIPKLITMVKRTASSYERGKLLKQMILCCRLSWDLEQLQTVCAFAEEFMRNDVCALLPLLLDIHEKFLTVKLPGSVWIILSAMARRIFSGGHLQQELLFAHEGLFSHYFANQGDFEDVIRIWITDFALINTGRMWYTSLLVIPSSTHKRNFLHHLYPQLKFLMDQLSENDFQVFIDTLLKDCLKVNLYLSELPDKGQLLVSCLCNYELRFDSILLYKHKLDYQPFSCKLFASSPLLFNFILKASSNLITMHLNEIFALMLKYYRFKDATKFLQSKRLLSFHNLTDSIKILCLKAVDDSQDLTVLESVYYIYSHVARFDEYLQQVRPYLSNEPKINPDNPHAKLIISIPSQFVNIKPISDALPIVLPCLVGGGDLLYPALPAFLRFCYTMPVSNVLPVLTPLLEVGVSVAKKAMRLFREVCPLGKAVGYFENAWTLSKHYSARLVIFECIRGIFLDNPSILTWRILKNCLSNCDSSLFEALPRVDDIPDEYFVEFTETVWEILKPATDSTIKRRFLSGIENRVHVLPKEICRTIISHSLFIDDSFVSYFTTVYLIRGECHINDKIDFILTLFLERSASNFSSVVEFINDLCLQRTTTGFRPVFKEFSNIFEKYLASSKYRNALLQMKYVELCESAENGDSWKFEILPDIGRLISSYWLTLPEYYLLAPLLPLSLTRIFQENGPLEAVLAGILCEDPAICLIVLASLPETKFDSSLSLDDFGLSSIDWSKGPHYIAMMCQQYICNCIRNVSEPVVQQSLSKVMLERNNSGR